MAEACKIALRSAVQPRGGPPLAPSTPAGPVYAGGLAFRCLLFQRMSHRIFGKCGRLRQRRSALGPRGLHVVPRPERGLRGGRRQRSSALVQLAVFALTPETFRVMGTAPCHVGDAQSCIAAGSFLLAVPGASLRPLTLLRSSSACAYMAPPTLTARARGVVLCSSHAAPFAEISIVSELHTCSRRKGPHARHVALSRNIPLSTSEAEQDAYFSIHEAYSLHVWPME